MYSTSWPITYDNCRWPIRNKKYCTKCLNLPSLCCLPSPCHLIRRFLFYSLFIVFAFDIFQWPRIRIFNSIHVFVNTVDYKHGRLICVLDDLIEKCSLDAYQGSFPSFPEIANMIWLVLSVWFRRATHTSSNLVIGHFMEDLTEIFYIVHYLN